VELAVVRLILWKIRLPKYIHLNSTRQFFNWNNTKGLNNSINHFKEEERMKKILIGTLIVVAGLFMLSTPNVLAQEPCESDFTCDGDVDADDVATFLEDFGRFEFNNPCPNCYDSPCPCTTDCDPPAPVPKTGQTTSMAAGDDGDHEKGVVWPNPRFTANVDNNGNGDCGDRGETCDGTVTDNLTGLIWLKNADCFGLRMWDNALSDSNGLSSGLCGLRDRSNAGDWRLPNYKELFSLIDPKNFAPTLPTGHPFGHVQASHYWSSTTGAGFSGYAWYVNMGDGFVNFHLKNNDYYVWPVRGGQ
jgi:hypothetical protein